MVVAVLLDNFTTAANEEKERTARQKSDTDGRSNTYIHICIYTYIFI